MITVYVFYGFVNTFIMYNKVLSPTKVKDIELNELWKDFLNVLSINRFRFLHLVLEPYSVLLLLYAQFEAQ